MFNVELTDRAADLILMIFFQQIVCLIIANIVSLRQIPIHSSLEFTTDTPGLLDIAWLSNIEQKVIVVHIQSDLGELRQVAFKDPVVVQPVKVHTSCEPKEEGFWIISQPASLIIWSTGIQQGAHHSNLPWSPEI